MIEELDKTCDPEEMSDVEKLEICKDVLDGMMERIGSNAYKKAAQMEEAEFVPVGVAAVTFEQEEKRKAFERTKEKEEGEAGERDDDEIMTRENVKKKSGDILEAKASKGWRPKKR